MSKEVEEIRHMLDVARKKPVVWVHRWPLHGGGFSYAATLPSSEVVWDIDPAHVVLRIVETGAVARLDWETRKEPADIAVHAEAARLYASVYAARYAAGFPIPLDSARNPLTVPSDDAAREAAHAVLEWRSQFYPNTLPPSRAYGVRPTRGGVAQ